MMRVTFPTPTLRVKATERFEAIYPILKEVALAGSSGRKAMKHIAQQIFNFAVKAAGEGVPDLSREASDIFTWCLTQNPECYKQWDMLYLDNLEPSIVVMRKLSDQWKEHYVKDPKGDHLRESLNSFWQKNEKELEKTEDATRITLLKDAVMCCKMILGKLSQGHGFVKSMVIVSAALAVGAVVSVPKCAILGHEQTVGDV